MTRKITFLLALFITLFTACKKNDNVTQPIDISFQLAVDPAVISFKLPYQQASVTLINKINNERYTAKPTDKGLVSFEDLAPGTYSLNVSLTLTAAEFTTLSGIYRDKDFLLNHTMDNQSFQSSSNQTIQLTTSEAIGDWVIKQIYYASSDTKNGAVVRDFFYEIYNNATTTRYADSLCIATVFGKRNNNTGDYLLSNLQFDWSKSLNMAVSGDANTEYVYANSIFMIPSDATGRRYPVAPGKSIVIAQTAIDHTKPYTLNSGKTQEIADATLTVDLSKADFEVNLYPYEQKIQPGRTKNASDVDNPSVTDMETIYAIGMRDLILNPQGQESYALFKGSAQTIENIKYYAVPTVRTITANTNLYPQIPVSQILDAVEVAAIIEKDKAPRRLPQRLDAGSASVTGGPYSSQSIVRKTKQVINGRRILMDTNNSNNDFGVLLKADPSKGANSFID
ncbi:DUF4876 domain-containing protein [Sphingobacteriaceae bacterium WQ 2009]|uniref:DUF4876 domain-containing protein n=1 Tax=Rhinopithecimicrobium faecis TaxID=2820698 RepID=A0A8T4HBK3_9SPHI|nr:DUF4876 domain-containing protein [Sphingobacteriaceae bacterium WQ 2009]